MDRLKSIKKEKRNRMIHVFGVFNFDEWLFGG